ncbi:MAG: GNAT family N-acetyltransferase [Pseudomonadota bacterium]
MTPEDLAELHARAMHHGAPWSVESFASALTAAHTILVTQSASSWHKYSRGGVGGQTAPPPSATQHAAQLLGFALGRIIADEAELLTLAVDPDHQGAGLGKTLLERFEAESVSRGAKTSFLEVATDNQAARTLYSTAGWILAGTRAEYYPRGPKPAADALILRKVLTRAVP